MQPEIDVYDIVRARLSRLQARMDTMLSPLSEWHWLNTEDRGEVAADLRAMAHLIDGLAKDIDAEPAA